MPISSDPHETRKLFFWLVQEFPGLIENRFLTAHEGFGPLQMHQTRTTFFSGLMVGTMQFWCGLYKFTCA